MRPRTLVHLCALLSLFVPGDSATAQDEYVHLDLESSDVDRVLNDLKTVRSLFEDDGNGGWFPAFCPHLDAPCDEYLRELDRALRAGDVEIPRDLGSGWNRFGIHRSLAGVAIAWDLGKRSGLYGRELLAMNPRRPGTYRVNPGDVLLYLRDVVGIDLDEPALTSAEGASGSADREHTLLDWSVRAAAEFWDGALDPAADHDGSSLMLDLEAASWFVLVTRYLDGLELTHSPDFESSEWMARIAPVRDAWTVQDELVLRVTQERNQVSPPWQTAIDDLIARGADPGARSSLGMTPLDAIAWKSAAFWVHEPAEILLRLGARVDRPSQPSWPLPHEVVTGGTAFARNVPLLRMLLDQPGVDPNRWSDRAGLPVYSQTSDAEFLGIWLDAGADPRLPVGVPAPFQGVARARLVENMRGDGYPVDELLSGWESLDVLEALRRERQVYRLFLDNYTCRDDALNSLGACDGARDNVQMIDEALEVLAARGYR